MRDEIVAFVQHVSARTELSVRWILARLDLAPMQFYRWTRRVGTAVGPHAPTPRVHWLLPEERAAILAFHATYPDPYGPVGYRRMTYEMLDADVVAVSPSTVYRALREAGLLKRWAPPPSRKGDGFEQPTQPHEHWHIDVSYVNIAGTFYYLCSLLDGASRYLVHWELRAQMTTADVEIVIQRAREIYPHAHPRIISDNGPPFIARDFKELIRTLGMTHVRTSPYYPQSNGKLERWHQTLKVTTIRPHPPQSVEAARVLVAAFVTYYNHRRLHSAIGYITPADALGGRRAAIWAVRQTKLSAAAQRRRHAHHLDLTSPLTSALVVH